MKTIFFGILFVLGLMLCGAEVDNFTIFVLTKLFGLGLLGISASKLFNIDLRFFG